MTKTLESYLKAHYRPSTIKPLSKLILRFLNFYGSQSKDATYQDILNYIGHLRQRHSLHPKTLKHHLYGVKVYFNYLLETGQREDHPCSELQLKDKINKQIQVDTLYSYETLENFFESYQIRKKPTTEVRRPCGGKKHLFTRNKVIISLLIYQGLTVGEITALTLQDIDLEKGKIYIQKGHHQRARTLPLKARQILLFHHYLERDRPKLVQSTKASFGGLGRMDYFILGQYGETIQPQGINQIINENRPKHERLKPIKIRQSVIANLLKKENDPRIVQAFSGHRRTSTTIQYSQTAFEALQNAVNQYHPIR